MIHSSHPSGFISPMSKAMDRFKGAVQAPPASRYEALKDDQIRILKIWKSDNRQGLVKCTLKTVSLDRLPGYVALSYAWGKPSLDATIEVNGSEMKVTTNLQEALRGLRGTNISWAKKLVGGSLYLWADAVCINQSDTVERSRQVGLMTRIYQSAVRVAVWFGPEQHYTRDAFQMTKDMLSAYRDVAHKHWLDIRAHFDKTDFGFLGTELIVHSPARGRQRIANLCYLLKEPWWSILWVVREATLNSNTYLHSGPVHIKVPSWYELAVCFDLLMTTCRPPEDAPTQHTPRSHFSGVQSVSITEIIRSIPCDPIKRLCMAEQAYSLDDAVQTRAMYILLDSARFARTSNKHDHIYGLLGLLPGAIKIMPNYDRTPAESFSDAAFAIMRQTKSLELLFSIPTHSYDGPSWAPDFSSERLDLGRVRSESARSCFDASLHDCPVIEKHTGGALRSCGCYLDQVAVVSEVLISEGASDVAHATKLVRMARAFWEVNFAADASDPYAEHFWRLACNDIFYANNSAPGARCSRQDIRTMHRWGTGGSVSTSERRHCEGTIGWALQSNVIVYTTKGFFGVFQREVRTGDEVFVLQSASVPCVLRPRSTPGTYSFLGPCYVEAYMDAPVSDDPSKPDAYTYNDVILE